MDALSLLCTLHADGPATRKRLQNAGCPSLAALLERPLSEVAAALDVAPAAARRLLREARLLAERVGPDLEAEDAPAPVPATPGPEPFAVELPPVAAPATLDQGDRALLERIVRAGRNVAAEAVPGPALVEAELASVAARAAAATVPGLAPPPTALERVGIDLSAEGPWPSAAPEVEAESAAFVHVDQVVRKTAFGAFVGAEGTPEEPPSSAALQTHEAEQSSEVAQSNEVAETNEGPRNEVRSEPAPLLTLEGIDCALANKLVHAGIHSIEQLARADALRLARELHFTVAQAKRLCFVARRATGAGSRPLPVAASPPHGALSTPHVPPASLASPASHASPASPAIPQRHAWRIEPQSQPLAPAPEPPAPPPVLRVAAADAGHVPAPVAAQLAPTLHATPTAPHASPAVPRARFWEPRSGASADAGEPQGVPVDPAEVDRPRRFTDARRSAAQLPDAGPAEPPSAAQSDVDSSAPPPTVGTILGWNFEIPRPALPPATEHERRTWRPLEVDESSAGPFA